MTLPNYARLRNLAIHEELASPGYLGFIIIQIIILPYLARLWTPLYA